MKAGEAEAFQEFRENLGSGNDDFGTARADAGDCFTLGQGHLRQAGGEFADISRWRHLRG